MTFCNKMKTLARYIPLLLLVLGAYCVAEPTVATKIGSSLPIEMKRTSKGGITSFTFRRGDSLIYRLVFRDVIIQRAYFGEGGRNADLRVLEYDLDEDGNVDAIQIGEDDTNFTPYFVSISDGKIDVEALSNNWKDGSEYPYDAFMKYVKKRKNLQ